MVRARLQPMLRHSRRTCTVTDVHVKASTSDRSWWHPAAGNEYVAQAYSLCIAEVPRDVRTLKAYNRRKRLRQRRDLRNGRIAPRPLAAQRKASAASSISVGACRGQESPARQAWTERVLETTHLGGYKNSHVHLVGVGSLAPGTYQPCTSIKTYSVILMRIASVVQELYHGVFALLAHHPFGQLNLLGRESHALVKRRHQFI